MAPPFRSAQAVMAVPRSSFSILSPEGKTGAGTRAELDTMGWKFDINHQYWQGKHQRLIYLILFIYLFIFIHLFIYFFQNTNSQKCGFPRAKHRFETVADRHILRFFVDSAQMGGPTQKRIPTKQSGYV